MPISEQLVTSAHPRVAEGSGGRGKEGVHQGAWLCPTEVKSSPPESVREKACYSTVLSVEYLHRLDIC